MRREDMTVPVALIEAGTIILGVCYLILQIYYGIHYHISPSKFIWNVCAVLLVYVAILLLQFYPEKVNRLPIELFSEEIRKLTVRMLRLIKLVFVAGLLVPCVFDVLGIGIYNAASLIVVVLIAAIAIYYEMKIYRILREKR